MKTILRKTWAKVRRRLRRGGTASFPLTPPLPLPAGVSEERLRAFLGSVTPADAPPQEMANYCGADFRRFVYTYGLAAGLTGRCLELGANPYFTTMLLHQFARLQLTLANYFGPQVTGPTITQEVLYKDFHTGQPRSLPLTSYHFNTEEERFPFEDASFDVVLFCEIIEHLLNDPAGVLREIKRVLRPGGVLILTTPNVSRLENVARMIAGENIYDPYSGYGPYGRHNREYNQHDLHRLLTYLGFTPDPMFTADVHANHAEHYAPVGQLAGLLRRRAGGLGQYIFVRAVSDRPAGLKKPSFLYRSYPAHEQE